jgi:hypothetical protein
VNRADLPRREPLIQQISVDEAYYAVDDDGTLTIALRRNRQSMLFPRLSSEWAMSMVLEGLPAGRERLYPLSTREVRAAQSIAGDHRRWRALMGVAVVQAPQGGRLRGRFHATVQQQQYGLLTGWTPPVYQGPVMVLLGEFEAVLNASRVDELVERTEADGFERPVPSAATRPEPLELRATPRTRPAPPTTTPADS